MAKVFNQPSVSFNQPSISSGIGQNPSPGEAFPSRPCPEYASCALSEVVVGETQGAVLIQVLIPDADVALLHLLETYRPQDLPLYDLLTRHDGVDDPFGQRLGFGLFAHRLLVDVEAYAELFTCDGAGHAVDLKSVLPS